MRWNEDRAAAVADQAGQVLRCYSGHLQHSLNELSQQLLGRKLVEDCTKPGEYTGTSFCPSLHVRDHASMLCFAFLIWRPIMALFQGS